MDPVLAHDLGERFMRLMIEKRARSEGANPAPDSTAPQTTALATRTQASSPSSSFYREIISLSNVPQRYQRPGLLDKALDTLDLGIIYSYADEIAAQDDSKELGHQDCVIRALLRHFKRDFFTWITAPRCSQCDGETDGIGAQRPSLEEQRKGASRTEIYRCRTHPQSHIERFPRYDDPETLLDWRKGRCGEWANCFTLCCLALGSRARWVWNAEDHVWTEVWSERMGRWVHCDPCEDAFDQPQLYAVGWNKKMSYVLGFSSEGMQDVTRRYVRKADQKVPRLKGSETDLKQAIKDVNDRSRSEEAIERLTAEDEAEEKELAGYVAEDTPAGPEAERPRESGSASWKEARGETGKK